MAISKEFVPTTYSRFVNNGKLSFRAPSNIALIKYWGKYGEQLPKNPSISFTLDQCHTITTLHFERKEQKGFDFKLFLDNQRAESFESKIRIFFERILPYVPFLETYQFRIETSNSFPHSSGIASSASGMSALALCLVALETQLMENPHSSAFFNQKSSFLARLGSGSAARSIEGPLVVWGEHSLIPGSSQQFGTLYPFEIHSNFHNYQDTILLVETGKKEVSSTVGHDLMHGHPFAEQRFRQANDNLSQLIPVLADGNLSEFIRIVENEALSLHAMMMTSNPSFILMKPNTLEIIQRIWNFRKEEQSHVCFTLDAGANVHVLYPEEEKKQVRHFIDTELRPYCSHGKLIHDWTGNGAVSK